MNSQWVKRLAPCRAPRSRLICFPHAGAGASAYRLWSAELRPDVELCSVELPGREGRFREATIHRISTIVDALLPALRPLIDLPYVFFGHSMGAVVASEVTHALAERGIRLPRHLFVSARRPPHIPSQQSPLQYLSDQDFVAEMNRRYDAIPAELIDNADVLALVLPALRADITALETHRAPRRPPLVVPITAFGGADDAVTPPAFLADWRGETSGAFRMRIFPGGHFYLKGQRTQVVADITATLDALVGEVA